MTVENPWVYDPAEVDEPVIAASPAPDVASDPWRPQLGVQPPGRVLGRVEVDDSLTLWIVGAHGGSGETTIADLVERGSGTEHRWPTSRSGAARHVVLTARTHAYGLSTAQAAVREWGAGGVSCVLLRGLVLVADAPGRLPKPLERTAELLSGAFERVWRIPYLEPWRVGAVAAADDHRAVRRTVADLNALKMNP